MAEPARLVRGLWERVRRDFEGRALTEAAICRKHAIDPDELWTHARAAKWQVEHRTSGLDRGILIRQMLGVLERQVARLERIEMTDTGEKEAAVLGRLASTLDKLIELESRNSKAEQPAETAEMRDIRNKLVKRILRLKRS
jgi:hypothetical protein